MVEHRNTTATVRVVLAACETLGVDADELLRLAQIDRDTAFDIDGEVSLTQMRDFWRHAYRLSGDPFLALRAGRCADVGTYRCLDYLLVNSATFGDAIGKTCRYFGLINTWIDWKIDARAGEVVVEMRAPAGPIPPPPIEFTWAVFTHRARHVLWDDWSPARVSFPFAPPADSTPHAAYFRCPLVYEAPAAQFVVAEASWKQPLQTSNKGLSRVLDEHARLLLERRPRPDDLVERVRQRILRGLHGGDPSREAIAKQLGMSPRTLQRRLAQRSVAYAKLLDEVRAETAKSHLRKSDLGLCEVGFLLGFSEQSAFTRAFKRWTGRTPREYRRMHAT